LWHKVGFLTILQRTYSSSVITTNINVARGILPKVPQAVKKIRL